MFTRHGHHIPGTVKDQSRPKFVKRCGGVNHCKQCTAEWEKVYEMRKQPVIVGEVPVTIEVDGKKTTVGTAKMEKTDGGHLIAHVDIQDPRFNAIMDGFSLGSFSIRDE